VKRRDVLLGCLCAPFIHLSARAQEAWPSRPVTIVVPFQPGGSSDTVARALSPTLQGMIGRPVVVESRPGANGEIAARYVMRSEADGHTLMIGSIGTWAINPALRPDLGYDPLRDFAPIALAATTYNVLVVNPAKVPVTDAAGLVAWLKANVGKTAYASAGIGSSEQMTMELFKQITGTDPSHVPYSGSGPAIMDLLGGNVDLTATNLGLLVPHIQAGRLRPLLVTASRRSPLLPDVPTAAEAGLPDLVVSSWQAIMAPARIPASLAQKVSGAMVESLQDSATRKRLEPIGFEVSPGSAEQLRGFLSAETERWRAVIQRAGIRAE
jgi:tripartite-type tricarboxylate transporter receptor subunit TctC